MKRERVRYFYKIISKCITRARARYAATDYYYCYHHLSTKSHTSDFCRPTCSLCPSSFCILYTLSPTGSFSPSSRFDLPFRFQSSASPPARANRARLRSPGHTAPAPIARARLLSVLALIARVARALLFYRVRSTGNCCSSRRERTSTRAPSLVRIFSPRPRVLCRSTLLLRSR